MISIGATGALSLAIALAVSIVPAAPPAEEPALATPKDGRSILNELSQISIDPVNTFRIREVNIDRDALHLTLHRGTVAFLKPVFGHITGAVFVGEGEILVIPPSKIERFQLNKFTNSPVLTERFSSAVFRFTDNLFNEITKGEEEVTSPQPIDLNLKSTWDDAVRSLSTNLNYRILQDLLATHPHPFFQASLNGRTRGWFEALYDERSYEPVLLGNVTHEQGINYADIWCSFRAKRPREDQDQLSIYHITSVSIETSINAEAQVTATARLELNSRVEGERLFPFELSRGLKVSSVKDGAGHSFEFFQNSLLEGHEIAQRGNDLVYVLLDHPTRKDEPLTLVFEYSGDVITNLGNGVYFVGARGTWYPNHGLSDAARYHLKFRYPSSMTLVATGNLINEITEGTVKTSEWDSGGIIGVAGFNLGDYLTKSQRFREVDVEVFANRGLEAVVRDLQARLDQLRAARIAAMQQSRPHSAVPPSFSDPVTLPSINTQTILTEVISDTASALQFLESWFGPYPYKKLAISQIPGRFGQGWPSLCYVSTLTFLPREEQRALGLDRDSQFAFSQLMRTHEIAHQWWGNLVGAYSYHETWLTEGMANYAARIYAASKDPRNGDLVEAMRHLKIHLLEKEKAEQTIESAGPIWLGWRLYSSKTPAAFQDVVYGKGAWVIHMVRMMMRDPQTQSDAHFIVAMKAFLTQFKDRGASTEDFKKTIEQHMTHTMDLEGNRKMDWFFDEWVKDVGIPVYQLNYSLGGIEQNGYLVSGRILQSAVPASFEMPVPVFAHYGNRSVQVAIINVSGEETPFRIHLTGSKLKPSKITLNDNESVLCVVKSK
jgi:Peptidase family M1 domain